VKDLRERPLGKRGECLERRYKGSKSETKAENTLLMYGVQSFYRPVKRFRVKGLLFKASRAALLRNISDFQREYGLPDAKCPRSGLPAPSGSAPLPINS